MLKATFIALALASSPGLAAQEMRLPTGSDGIGLRVSQAVGDQLISSPYPLSLPTRDTVSLHEISREEPVDVIASNIAYLMQKYADPCRAPELTMTAQMNCQIAQRGPTDTAAGRDVRDWQIRQSQVVFANRLAKTLLGDVVSLTEGTLTQPSKIVWFQYWRFRWKIDTSSGRAKSNFEIGYYRPF